MKEKYNIFNSISKSEKPGLPKDYFNNLENEILQKVSSLESEKTSKSNLQKIVIWTSSAAAILIVILSVNMFNNSTATNISKIENIDIESIENYLETNISELDDELISEIYNPKAFIEEGSSNKLKNNNINQIDLDVIENYLEDNYYEYDDESV